MTSTPPTVGTFNPLTVPSLEKYEKYIPTAFNSELTMLQKVNYLIQYLSTVTDTVNGFGDQWNQIVDWVDGDGLNQDVINQLTAWLNDGTLANLLSVYADTKLKNWVMVTDYLTGNETDHTAAFQSAVNDTIAHIILTNGELPTNSTAQGTVFVPSGSYTITSLIDTKNEYITFVLQNGAVITGIDYLDGKVYIEGERISTNTFSNKDDGAGFSVRVNPDSLENQAGIFGIQSLGQLGTTQEFGSVSLFADNQSPLPLITITNASFTDKTVICSPPLTVDQMSKLRKGMAIRTTNATPCASFIVSWASDGTSITIDTGWYPLTGATSTPITPDNGSTVYVNTPDKIWAHNANVILRNGSPVQKSAGFELGFLNNSTYTPQKDGDMYNQPYSWGYDSISLSPSKGTSAHIARGKWFEGFLSSGQDIGFRVRKDNSTPNVQGFVYEAEGSPFVAKNGNTGANYFSVGHTGNLEIGSQDTAQTTVVDLHSSGTPVDYDARIQVSGGNGTTPGQGTVTMLQTLLQVASDLRSNTDLSHSLGSPTQRWNNVYAQEIIPTTISLQPTTASAVGNGRMFIDSADSKLKFKDNTGTVNLLY